MSHVALLHRPCCHRCRRRRCRCRHHQRHTMSLTHFHRGTCAIADRGGIANDGDYDDDDYDDDNHGGGNGDGDSKGGCINPL